MLQPGVVLSERYRLDDRLGRGAMGDVWRATDLLLGRTVAVKALLPTLIADPGFSARFFAEARIMAALHHPGIVNVYDYGESPLPAGVNAVYLVMECVEGEPLSARMEAKGRLSVTETLSVISQAASALQAAHDSEIVHRDVKPSNLLVTEDWTIRLADFGVARSVASAALTATNAVLGTARYMAPEQALGRSATAAADIYALGAVAYHCLAGVPPFEGETPIEVALHHVQDEPPPLPEDIPPQVRQLIGRAMAKDPGDRFPTAAAFGHAAAMLRATSAGKADNSAHSTVVTNGQPIRAAALVPALDQEAAPGKAGSTLSDMLPVGVGVDRRRRGTKVAAAGAGLGLALLATFVFADMWDKEPSGQVTPTVAPSEQPSKVDPAKRPDSGGGRVTISPGVTPTPTPAAPQSSGAAPTTQPTTEAPTTTPPVTETTDPPPATPEVSPEPAEQQAGPPGAAEEQVNPTPGPALEQVGPPAPPDNPIDGGGQPGAPQ